MRFKALCILALKLISLRESLRLTRRKFELNDNGATSNLKRTKNFPQSDLSDFVYKPGNLFQGGLRGLLRLLFKSLQNKK